MKLAHPQMENVIELQSDRVSTLVIENRRFFSSMLRDIYRQTEGGSGPLVLSENMIELDMSKYADLTDSFLSFTLNRKPLLNKILSALEKQALSGEMFPQTAEILTGIERYIDELAHGFSCDIDTTKLSVSAVLRMAGIYVRDDYDNHLERIIDYMELTREFDRDKLFIFVNMRSYFEDEELELFFETVLAHEYKLLLIDSHAAPLLKNEKRLVIDEDLCEF